MEDKNLVRDFLTEEKVIESEKFMYSYFYEDIEWFAYKLSDDAIMYLYYELTPHGLGYAFVVTIKCARFSYEIKPKYYAKSYGNIVIEEWNNISEELKDKLLSDAIRDLNVWKKNTPPKKN